LSASQSGHRWFGPLSSILALNAPFRHYSPGEDHRILNAKQESNMRRLIVTSIVLAVISLAGLLVIASAQAMTAPIPIGLAGVIDKASSVEDVAYVCRRVRRCGPNGCVWRRECRNTGPGYGGGYYGGYGYNPCGPGWSVQDGVCKPYRGY
jgi:hypothetical protein